MCLNDADRWTPQQLLDHSFLKPPLPKNLQQYQDASPEGDFLIYLCISLCSILTVNVRKYYIRGNDLKSKPHFVADCLVVSSDLAVDFASTVIPQNLNLTTPVILGVQRQFSRYFNEFEELQLLGKGAFGAVIKV